MIDEGDPKGMQHYGTADFLAHLTFIGDEGLGRVDAAFGPEHYERLRRIKHVWDPTNQSRHNQNLPPLADG